jgi:ADP-ribose pyrophosphatase
MKRSAQRTIMAEGRYLRLVNSSGWEFAERSRGLEAVAVIAVTRDNELILTEQFRVPLGKSVIDLPAGLVGDEGADTLEAAAARELEEETGFKARRFRKVFSGPTSAGLSNEVVNLLMASGVTRVGEGGGVSGESIKVHLVKLDRLVRWLRKYERTGGMVSPNVLVALALLQNRRSFGR